MQPEPATRTVTITVGRGQKNSTRLERRTMSLEALFKRLRYHEPSTKENAEFVIPGDVAECPTPCRQHGGVGANCGGGQIHRLALNSRSIEALFLDFDNWNSDQLAAALARVEATGYQFICYSSPSYAPPEKAKVRIVFPLAAPFRVSDPRHWRDLAWPALVAMVGLPDADRACSDVSRVYYLPSLRAETAEVLVREGGSRLLEVPNTLPIQLVPPTVTRALSQIDLIAQLRADVEYPPHVELVERIADGAALGEAGDRHSQLLKATWLMAGLNPRPTTECVEALLARSCEAMGDDRDFLQEAALAYERACDKRDDEAPEVADFRARLDEQSGTDKAFARRLWREYGDRARYVPGIGWHTWDGQRWASWGDRPTHIVADLRAGYEADLAALRARLAEIREQMQANAAVTTPTTQDANRRLGDLFNALTERADKFYKNVLRPTQQAATANSILRVAEDMPEFRAQPDAFDADPWALNVTNGIIDLRTGALRPHDPNALCTKLAPTSFDPAAAAPLFERVLSEALPDAEVRGFFQRVIGYALTGDVREDLLFLLLGEGGNGKSLLLNAIKQALGEYAGVAPKSLLMHGGKFAAPSDHQLADIRGRRLIHIMEVKDREFLDSSKLKALVGGDPITAARKYENSTTFKPQAKVLMPCNSLPRVTDTDTGAWRRLALIEFPVSFVGSEDRTLSERLGAESSGILAWAVRGCLEWQRGMRVPAQCRKAIDSYRELENDVTQFALWWKAEHGAGSALATPLFDAYVQWSERMQLRPRSLIDFSRQLSKAGLMTYSKDKAGSRWTCT